MSEEADPGPSRSTPEINTPDSEPSSDVPLFGSEHSRRHAIEVRGMTPLMVLLTLLTSFCGFLFGYDTGYISSALVSVGNDLGKALTAGDKEFITSATSLGALISSLMAGSLADIFGRKWVITGANVLFIVGAIMQTAAHTLWTMISGRLVMGFGVGIASQCAPLYISEMAPSRYRGRLIVVNVMAITFGQLIAYAIGAGLTKVFNGWRVMVGLSLIPSVAQMILFFFMPETPRYLVRHKRIDDAKRVFGLIYKNTTQAEIDAKIEDLAQYVSITSPPGQAWYTRVFSNLKELHSVRSNFRALVITCGLMGIQQFTGFNSLMYYSASIFQSVGFNNSVAVSIIVAGTNFVFTVVAFLIIDRVGRRRLLLSTIWGMALGLTLNAIAFHYLPPLDETGNQPTSRWAPVVIVSMMIYVAFYATGIGNVPWQQSELFPMTVRGIGTSFATATNWTGSLVIASTFLTMLDNITPTGTFAFYAGLCVISEIFVYFLYPETAGLSLEEIQGLLTDGFNVNKSVELSRKIKEFYSQAVPGEYNYGSTDKVYKAQHDSTSENAEP